MSSPAWEEMKAMLLSELTEEKAEKQKLLQEAEEMRLLMQEQGTQMEDLISMCDQLQSQVDEGQEEVDRLAAKNKDYLELIATMKRTERSLKEQLASSGDATREIGDDEEAASFGDDGEPARLRLELTRITSEMEELMATSLEHETEAQALREALERAREERDQALQAVAASGDGDAVASAELQALRDALERAREERDQARSDSLEALATGTAQQSEAATAREALERRIDELEASEARLQDEVQGKVVALDDAHTRVREADARVREGEQRHERELAQLKEQLQGDGDRDATHGAGADDLVQLQMAQFETRQWRERAEEALAQRPDPAVVSRLETQLRDTESKLRAAQTALSAAQERAQQAEQRVSSARDAQRDFVQRAQADVAAAQADAKAAREAEASARAQAEQANREATAARAQAAASGAALEEAQAAVDAATVTQDRVVGDLRAGLATALASQRAAEQRAQQAQERAREAEQRLHHQAGARTETASSPSRAERGALQRATQAEAALAESRRAQEEQAHELGQLRAQLKQALEQASRDLVAHGEHTQLDAALRGARAQVGQLQRRLRAQAERFRRHKEGLERAQTQVLSQMGELRAQHGEALDLLSQACAELSAARRQPGAASSSSTLEQLQETRTRLSTVRSRLAQAMRSLESVRSERDAAVRQLRVYQSEADSLQMRLTERAQRQCVLAERRGLDTAERAMVALLASLGQAPSSDVIEAAPEGTVTPEARPWAHSGAATARPLHRTRGATSVRPVRFANPALTHDGLVGRPRRRIGGLDSRSINTTMVSHATDPDRMKLVDGVANDTEALRLLRERLLHVLGERLDTDTSTAREPLT